MKTAYERINGYDGPTDLFRDFLKKHGYDKVFDTLYEMYDSATLIKNVVFYIINCYSADSEFISSGESWTTVKENVARHFGIPDEVQDKLVFLGNYQDYNVKRKKKKIETTEDAEEQHNLEEQLEDDEDVIWDDTRDEDLPVNKIIAVINRWLDYQNFRDWKHLCMLQDQYEEMMVASQTKLIKSGGGVDFDTKAKCRQQARMILDEIEQFEKKIRDRDPVLIKDAKKEIKHVRPEAMIL